MKFTSSSSPRRSERSSHTFADRPRGSELLGGAGALNRGERRKGIGTSRRRPTWWPTWRSRRASPEGCARWGLAPQPTAGQHRQEEVCGAGACPLSSSTVVGPRCRRIRKTASKRGQLQKAQARGRHRVSLAQRSGLYAAVRPTPMEGGLTLPGHPGQEQRPQQDGDRREDEQPRPAAGRIGSQLPPGRPRLSLGLGDCWRWSPFLRHQEQMVRQDAPYGLVSEAIGCQEIRDWASAAGRAFRPARRLVSPATRGPFPVARPPGCAVRPDRRASYTIPGCRLQTTRSTSNRRRGWRRRERLPDFRSADNARTAAPRGKAVCPRGPARG